MKKILLGLIFLNCCFFLIGCSADKDTSSARFSSDSSQESSVSPTEKIVSGASTTSTSGENTDVTTSASIVPDNLVQTYSPNGFSEDESKEKVLFVVGDPRKYSVNYDLANTAMEYFETKGLEVELRDLYDVGFNPVLSEDTFYNAKDGTGETPEDVKTEQSFISQADHIVFVYPNWHDTPNAIVKGYMERVFAKQFAYTDSSNGLEGLLVDKDIYTIMNCGYLGGGQGFIGDGVGNDDETWDTYMEAFNVFDEDTAKFWGVSLRGRFMNDQTPKNGSSTYEAELNSLRSVLKQHLEEDFFS